MGRPQHRPMMQIVVSRPFFDLPPEVRRAKRDPARYRRQLVVVDEDDSPRAHEPAEVNEVEEHAVEPVIAVDERKVEAAIFGEEARKYNRRFLRVVLDEMPYPRPISTVRAACSRFTQSRRASPSAALAATGKRLWTVPSDRATAVRSLNKRSITCRISRGDRFSTASRWRATSLSLMFLKARIAGPPRTSDVACRVLVGLAVSVIRRTL